MIEKDARKELWESKILPWESARYSRWLSLYPPAWPIRQRLNDAARIIKQRAKPTWQILELGCGSGLLAERLRGHVEQYLGIDIASAAIEKARAKFSGDRFKFEEKDVTGAGFEPCELTVFLGLSDWLTAAELSAVFAKCQSKHVLFSYTENRAATGLSPYRIYRKYVDGAKPKLGCRARNYSFQQVQEILYCNGFAFEIVREATFMNPGVLIWATKQK